MVGIGTYLMNNSVGKFLTNEICYNIEPVLETLNTRVDILQSPLEGLASEVSYPALTVGLGIFYLCVAAYYVVNSSRN